MLINLCAETIKPVWRGTESDGCGRNESVYHVYPSSCITGEERAECLRGWGEGRQINLCAETIYVRVYSMRVGEGRNSWNLQAIRMARTVTGRGEKDLLSDPGSEIRLGA